MGGARSLTGAMGATAAPAAAAGGDVGTRPSLDEAIAKLEKRGGPFMNVMLKKLRAQQQAAVAPSTNLAGTTSRVAAAAPAIGALGSSVRTSFMGGY